MKYAIIITLLFAAMIMVILNVSFGFDNSLEGNYRFWERPPGVAPTTNKLYNEECGSCHFAYQPGLLPKRSWRKIMTNLEDHYGDNAELDSLDQQVLLDYVIDNSADNAPYRRSRKIMRSMVSSFIPERIINIPYIKRKHKDIPNRFIQGNKEIQSMSQCEKCHQTIESGSFSERSIKIPGYEGWDV